MKRRYIFFSIHITQIAIFASVLLLISITGIWVSLSFAKGVDGGHVGRLAIVIDDFGLQRKGVQEMLALDCKLTVAIMPFLEYTEDDAEDALENGKEIILHIPMQATTHDVPSHLGPRPITTRLSGEEIHQWIEDALKDVPEAVGANIHMGTLSSTKESVMMPVLEGLKAHNLFFLDSKTSSKSVCQAVALAVDIPFYENDVFLEHEKKTKSYIKSRLEKAVKIAQKEGSCIAIGHVGYEGGKVTAEAIRELLPELEKQNVELVFLSELSPLEPS